MFFVQPICFSSADLREPMAGLQISIRFFIWNIVPSYTAGNLNTRCDVFIMLSWQRSSCKQHIAIFVLVGYKLSELVSQYAQLAITMFFGLIFHLVMHKVRLRLNVRNKTVQVRLQFSSYTSNTYSCVHGQVHLSIRLHFHRLVYPRQRENSTSL